MDLHPIDRSRRDFLIRSCQGASSLLLAKFAFDPLAALAFQESSAPEFHLHPHYRSQRPLQATLALAQAGLDDFVSEKYAEQIEAVLAAWGSELQSSPQATGIIKKILASEFSGSSVKPSGSRALRSGAVEVWRNAFSPPSLPASGFLPELRSSLDIFSKILTAEFQVTRIDIAAPRLRTRVRYDLVGSGKDFYREHRNGEWDLEWLEGSSGGLQLTQWTIIEETRSRSNQPVFADISVAAFGGNLSYRDQVLHGVDYWRTVLDGASGIDIYGHNGVSVGDIDSDGLDDLYVCQPAGLPNRLFRNRGDGTFEDITESAGVGVLENTACALLIDINNDGLQDLIVVRTNGPLLFLNQGNGKFRQKPEAFRFATPPQGTFTGAAAADYDRDGWLDIYFCLYAYYQGTDQYKYPLPYYDANNGPPNFLMRNNRDGTFSDVTQQSGLNQNNTRYSFCCGWNDYNGDGWPDLYVVNDFGRKSLYRNNGDGTFVDVATEMGVEDIGAGMSVCWLDFDNDGVEDLYVANMWTAAGVRVSTQDIFQKNAPEGARALYQKHAMGNSLFRNTGKGMEDMTGHAGVGMGRWSWSSDAWDFDHDGFPDLYIVNGMVSGPSRHDLNSFFWRQVVANSPNEAKPAHEYEQAWNAINELIRSDGTWSGYEHNVFYVNHADGTFSDVSGALGLDFLEDGRSFALADFDRDGRQEFIVKNRNAPGLRLIKNVAGNLPPSISFRLRGAKSNRDAIGAVLTIEAAGQRQVRSVQAGSGFLSQHSKEIFFGLGPAKGPVRATIRWPNGAVQELHDLPANHRIWVQEGSPDLRVEPFLERLGLPRKVAEETTATLPDICETWLLAPVSAPDFELPDLEGKPWSLSALRGKPLLLNFWDSRSPACVEGLHVLEQQHTRWSTQGLHLLTVNVDGPSDDAVRKLVREQALSLPVLLATDDVAGIYNILYKYLFDRQRDLGLPTAFLLDAKGDIVKVYQGAIWGEHVDEDFRHIPQTDGERLSKALPFPGVIESADFSRNYLSVGSIYFQRGYYDQAGASFERTLHDEPNSAEAWYGLGSVYLQQQKIKEARDAFERVTKLQATYPDTLPNAWNNLGLLATREGRTADAIPYFQKALKLSPDHLVALTNLGNGYRQQKQWEDARGILQHAVDIAPKDPEANYSLAMVYAQLNDSEQAYDYLQRALKYRPAYPEALNNLGVLYLRTGRRNQAVASFEECMRVAPEFEQSYLNLARVYALEGAPDKAREVLARLLQRHPDQPQAKEMLRELGSQ